MCPTDHLLKNFDFRLDFTIVETRAAVPTRNFARTRPTIAVATQRSSQPAHRRLRLRHSSSKESATRSEVHFNLAYRWFCRLGLDGDVLDHSTFFQEPPRPLPRQAISGQVFQHRGGRCMTEGEEAKPSLTPALSWRTRIDGYCWKTRRFSCASITIQTTSGSPRRKIL